mgnify:CR=1 FL=1
MLQIKEIYKKYITGDLQQTALNGVSLNLRDNEFVAILGTSGSGKTTLLNIIGGLDRYDSGDLIINGVSTEKYTDRDWDSYRNHSVGFVFQSYNLIPHQSVLANVELALTISGISKGERRKRAKEALERVGLGNQYHKKPNQMSGGQMQRVAIARCLVMNPRVMLFDEPTSALDPIATAEVMDVMRKLKKEIPLVIITHKMSLVKEIADRVIFMQNGRICEEGPTAELLNTPKQSETRNFLNYQKNMMYQIDSHQFDRPELNARIECYCNRFGLGSQAFHFVQLVVEELLNLLPLEQGVQLMLSKSDTEVRMMLDVVLPPTDVMYLDSSKVKDELSLSIVEGLCEKIQETVDEDGNKLIHLELNKERLLME